MFGADTAPGVEPLGGVVGIAQYTTGERVDEPLVELVGRVTEPGGEQRREQRDEDEQDDDDSAGHADLVLTEASPGDLAQGSAGGALGARRDGFRVGVLGRLGHVHRRGHVPPPPLSTSDCITTQSVHQGS